MRDAGRDSVLEVFRQEQQKKKKKKEVWGQVDLQSQHERNRCISRQHTKPSRGRRRLPGIHQHNHDTSSEDNVVKVDGKGVCHLSVDSRSVVVALVFVFVLVL